MCYCEYRFEILFWGRSNFGDFYIQGRGPRGGRVGRSHPNILREYTILSINPQKIDQLGCSSTAKLANQNISPMLHPWHPNIFQYFFYFFSLNLMKKTFIYNILNNLNLHTSLFNHVIGMEQ